MDFGHKRSMFLYGAFGGVLPTLAGLASTYVTAPATPLPEIGLYFGVLLWAIVGGGIALTNSTAEMRQAIFAGIAAPAIIASLVSGASDAAIRKKNALASEQIGIVAGLVVGTANAQEKQFNPSPAIQPSPPTQREPSQISPTRTEPPSTGPTQGAPKQFEPSRSVYEPFGTLLISSHVDGGNPTTAIPVTAHVKVGDKYETVTVGQLRAFDGMSAFTLPAGATQVSLFGKTIPVTGSVTPANVTITTRPSVVGDFLWALGAQRKFSVQDAIVTPSK